MANERNVLAVAAAILLGIAPGVPTSARTHHWRAHFHQHDGPVNKVTSPPTALTPLSQGHTVRQDAPDSKGSASPPDQTHGTEAETPSNRAPIIERGARQNPEFAQPRGDNVKERISGAHENSGNFADVHMKDLGPIDTRITVLGRAVEGMGDSGSKTKSRLIIPGVGRGFHSHAAWTTKSASRNAIGIRVDADRDYRHENGPADLAAVAMHAAGAPGARPIGLMGKPSLRDDRPRLVRPGAGPSTLPPVVGRAAINGTGLLRRGFAPAIVGGPPRRIAGISGSMFRSKR